MSPKVMPIVLLIVPKKALTHYSLVLLIYNPENIIKSQGFLMFSGGIDKQHRTVMG